MATTEKRPHDIEIEEAKQKLSNVLNELEGDWVLIRTYARREHSVSDSISNRLTGSGLEDALYEIIVPEETVIEIDKTGQKKKTTRVVQPGYILARMDIYNEDAVFEIRRTNGVLGYAGSNNSYEPVALTNDEVIQLMVPTIKSASSAHKEDALRELKTTGVKSGGTKVEIDYVVGDVITVVDGPFMGMDAIIDEIDLEHERVNVLISVFGRETPVDLKVSQVRKQIF